MYKSFNINLNKEKKKIEGVYFQYDKGCILYSLINEGWVDEQYIPDSVKFYKNHNYLEDKRENFYLKKLKEQYLLLDIILKIINNKNLKMYLKWYHKI